MPLPPALAAKLSKRGIITAKPKQDHIKKHDFKGVLSCPNKSNIYHDCTHWCDTHWKNATPDQKHTRDLQRLLVKYPLPNYWTEVFDKGLGRYYYWNMENDLVSWLPPKHPKSISTKSAAKLREKRILAHRFEKEEAEKKENEKVNKDKDPHRDSDDEEKSHYNKYSDKRDRDRDDRRSRKDDRYRSKRTKPDLLDPMDPAAYSDIPQGSWSDGLETNKSRADNTASGVLYQQRPYPAPGEVLAANREKKKNNV